MSLTRSFTAMLMTVSALQLAIPSATGILRRRTKLPGEWSENFAVKGRSETDGRAAADINQSHAKKERAIMARAHG